jgi:hypothetical protein
MSLIAAVARKALVVVVVSLLGLAPFGCGADLQGQRMGNDDALPVEPVKLEGVRGWQDHVVVRTSAEGEEVVLPAKFQVASEWWKVRSHVPYILYVPEKDQLAMFFSTPYEGGSQAPVMAVSDDHGDTWSEATRLLPAEQVPPGKGGFWLCVAPTYLGDGRFLFATNVLKWISDDYGATWRKIEMRPTEDGLPRHEWHTPFLDRDEQTGQIKRIVNEVYRDVEVGEGKMMSKACLRESTDLGETWSQTRDVPQWLGISEIEIIRAANGDLVGACRIDQLPEYEGMIDYYGGLGITISKDDGKTWSKAKPLFPYGRHHASMVRLGNGDLVMTYAVRAGYEKDEQGRDQFGEEAIISKDNGQTWDLDRRYVLHKWSAPSVEGGEGWAAQSSSTIQLPGGDLLTAYGIAYRKVGLVRWRPLEAGE